MEGDHVSLRLFSRAGWFRRWRHSWRSRLGSWRSRTARNHL